MRELAVQGLEVLPPDCVPLAEPSSAAPLQSQDPAASPPFSTTDRQYPVPPFPVIVAPSAALMVFNGNDASWPVGDTDDDRYENLPSIVRTF